MVAQKYRSILNYGWPPKADILQFGVEYRYRAKADVPVDERHAASARFDLGRQAFK